MGPVRKLVHMHSCDWDYCTLILAELGLVQCECLEASAAAEVVVADQGPAVYSDTPTVGWSVEMNSI